MVQRRGVCEDRGADGGYGDRRIRWRGRVGAVVGVVPDARSLLLRGRCGLALDTHLRELLRWHGGEGAVAVLGGDGKLGGDGVMLGGCDDVGFDEELEVLYMSSAGVRKR